jgi:DNA-directed RNA polymerase subunit E'/Rpb7
MTMTDISDSSEIYTGIVTYYNTRKYFGFIKGEENGSCYFYIDINQTKAKNEELMKLKQSRIRTIFFEWDEVNYKVRTVNGKKEAYDIEYLGNAKRQAIIDEAIEKQTLSGYLKHIDDKYFVKHIPTYIFIPLTILPVETDIEETYSKRNNQLVQFKIEKPGKIDKISAYLADRKINPVYGELKKAYDNDELVTGKITKQVKGGLIVEFGGIETFLPSSQIDVRPVRDSSQYVGQTMDFKIIKISVEFANVILSRQPIVKFQLEEQRIRTFSELEVGQVVEGTVENIKKYGAFINIDGAYGLIHISDLSHERVTNIEDIISLGQKINVMILDIDHEKKHISLGFKQLMDARRSQTDRV